MNNISYSERMRRVALYDAVQKNDFDMIKNLVEVDKENPERNTAPMPDFADVGDIFMTERDTFLLVTDDGKIRGYGKKELEKAREARKELDLKMLGKEVQINFGNREYFNEQVYFTFVLPPISEQEKRIYFADKFGIELRLDTPEKQQYHLVLGTDEIAIYMNPGDEILVMDLSKKEFMDVAAGYKRYHDIMMDVIDHGKGIVCGEKLASLYKKSNAYEEQHGKGTDNIQSIKKSVLHKLYENKSKVDSQPVVEVPEKGEMVR